jgi:hypothetical protein
MTCGPSISERTTSDALRCAPTHERQAEHEYRHIGAGFEEVYVSTMRPGYGPREGQPQTKARNPGRSWSSAIEGLEKPLPGDPAPDLALRRAP